MLGHAVSITRMEATERLGEMFCCHRPFASALQEARTVRYVACSHITTMRLVDL